MKKQSSFPVPVDKKVSQPGSVLETNARPLGAMVSDGRATPTGPERDTCENCPGEFHWPSHTSGRVRNG